ncbi:MAG: hypothetical protein HZB38_13220 [Planctomycetes bacterium]|nr:hypothetical protein [Planctomycetota bacterium]
MSWLLFADAGSIDVGATVLRVVHVAAAILAAGGAAFQLIALHPALAAVPEAQRLPIREAVAARWRTVIFACIAVLLLSGLLNFVVYRIPAVRSFPESLRPFYHGLFGVKVLAALAAFHAAMVLALPGRKGEAYRNKAGFWLPYLAACLAVVVILGVVLRSLGA